MYSLRINKSDLEKQSPKKNNKLLRPISNKPFSINDVNTNIVNFKGVNLKPTYDYNTMYSYYGQYMHNKNKDNNSNSLEIINDNINYSNNFDTNKTLASKNTKEIIKKSKVTFNINKCTNNNKNLKEYKPYLETEQNNQTTNNINNSVFVKQKSGKKLFLNNKNTCKNINLFTDSEFIQPPCLKNYTISNKSNSEWKTTCNKISFINHTSTNRHILNPLIKNISTTKEELIKNSKSNPYNRQKVISEYIDITRVGCPNPNKEYVKTINQNNNCFNIRSDICTKFNDSYSRFYNNLVSKPFKSFYTKR